MSDQEVQRATLPDDETSMRPITTGGCAEHLASLGKVWISNVHTYWQSEPAF